MLLGQLTLHPIEVDLEEGDPLGPQVQDGEASPGVQERRGMRPQPDFRLVVSVVQLVVHIGARGLVAVRPQSLHPPDPIRAPFTAVIAKVLIDIVFNRNFFFFVLLIFCTSK